jgi:hypothetical protein
LKKQAAGPPARCIAIEGPMTRFKKLVRCPHCGKPTAPLSTYVIAGQRVCYQAAREAAAAGQI